MTEDVSKKILVAYDSFSKGQRKIADLLLNDCEKATFVTAAKLGKLTGVSESTVVRFSSLLGYENYQDFQKALQDFVRSKMTTNQRIEATKQRIGNTDVLRSVMESDIRKISYTLEKLDREVFTSSVDSILGARTIYIAGARSTEPLARILYYHLSLIFDNVRMVNLTSSAEVFEQMYSINAADTLIAFSFPRYSSKIVTATKFARQQNASVVVFTDSEISPLCEFANHVITAESDMASYMDSLVAPLSIINAIIVEITKRREEYITKRFNNLEKIWDEYDVYAKR